MSQNKIEDKVYIQQKVDDILKNMMTKMFIANPSDPVSHNHLIANPVSAPIQVEFMQAYLRDNHGRRPAVNVNLRMELDFLRT